MHVKDPLLKQRIEEFLNAFLEAEYAGRDHILAREHYRELFLKLIPQYFKPVESRSE